MEFLFSLLEIWTSNIVESKQRLIEFSARVCVSWEQPQRKLTLKRYYFLLSTNGFGWDFTPNDYSAKLLLKLYLKAAQPAV